MLSLGANLSFTLPQVSDNFEPFPWVAYKSAMNVVLYDHRERKVFVNVCLQKSAVGRNVFMNSCHK